MSVALPDIVMVSATTSDSRSVTFDYDINNAAVDQPIHFEVYRSTTAQLGADAEPVGGVDVDPPLIPGGPTLDQAGQAATAIGSHELTVPLPGGLPPNPDHPYVLVVADPQNAIPEADKANNTASFRTYVLGVITHGGLQDKKYSLTGPPWERQMAAALLADGYDAVIPFNWVADSNHPGAAARQAVRLANMITQEATDFPADAPVDVHFIGHSEGAVVNSQAILRLNQEGWPANMKAGYLKVTMLDPHAANNAVKGPQYSVANGPLGAIAKLEINSYQSKADDPPVVVPPNVQDAEVFYQHTPVREAEGSNDGIYNLWGQVPVHGQASYFDLTAKGISHAGKFAVYDWYKVNVVPTLGNGGTFVQTDTLTGAEVPGSVTPSASGDRQTVTYTGTAAPGAVVRLFAAQGGTKALARVGRTKAGADGSWEITSRPIAPGTYRVVASSNAPQGPRRRRATMRPTVWLGHVTIGPAGPTSAAPNIPA
jgi:hypothetical protein